MQSHEIGVLDHAAEGHSDQESLKIIQKEAADFLAALNNTAINWVEATKPGYTLESMGHYLYALEQYIGLLKDGAKFRILFSDECEQLSQAETIALQKDKLEQVRLQIQSALSRNPNSTEASLPGDGGYSKYYESIRETALQISKHSPASDSFDERGILLRQSFLRLNQHLSETPRGRLEKFYADLALPERY